MTCQVHTMLITPSPTSHFYAHMRPIDDFVTSQDAKTYQQVPDDWDLIIAEVECSPDIIAQGLYKEVNALGAAAIITVNNVVRKLLPGVDLPFLFSGDGATILSPRCIRDEILHELSRLMTRARDGFGLDFHVGLLPILTLLERGQPVLVGKCRLSSTSSIALFSGSGYTLAHTLFQERDPALLYPHPTQGAPDLEGFECRWHPVPAKRGQIVSLMVKALESRLQRGIYTTIIQAIEEITDEHTHPLQIDQLQLSTNLHDFYTEAMLRSQKLHAMRIWLYQRVAYVINLIGLFLLRMGWKASNFNGATYLAEVIQHTDYRKFDDTLRMTLDLDARQLDELLAILDRMHAEHRIVYGVHCSESAQITCMIESHEQRHLHFIDGSNGGFVHASLQMKTQLESLQNDYLLDTTTRRAS